jgi:hypothetical protein
MTKLTKKGQIKMGRGVGIFGKQERCAAKSWLIALLGLPAVTAAGYEILRPHPGGYELVGYFVKWLQNFVR